MCYLKFTKKSREEKRREEKERREKLERERRGVGERGGVRGEREREMCSVVAGDGGRATEPPEISRMSLCHCFGGGRPRADLGVDPQGGESKCVCVCVHVRPRARVCVCVFS